MNLSLFGTTVLVDGIQLTSAVDRAREAHAQAEQVPADATEAWVYGPALGDLARALLERPQIQRLHVALLNAELDALVAKLIPQEWRTDPRVTIYPPGSVDTLSMPFACSPAELRFAEPAAHPLRDRLLALLGAPFNEFIFATLAEQWARQGAENAKLGDPDVRQLFDTCDRPAIVIAGGPTTAEHFDWIRARALASPPDKIIAVSTALLPLLAAGITPDVVVIVDRLPVMVKHFAIGERWKEMVLNGTRLAYERQVAPEIPRDWPGPRSTLCDLYPGGSVVHSAVDLATKIGARTVHLFGCDFCFPGESTHLAGAALAQATNRHRTYRCINGLGESVPTSEDMMHYRRALEDLIAQRPHVRFIKHDRRGVPLVGAEWGDDATAAAA